MGRFKYKDHEFDETIIKDTPTSLTFKLLSLTNGWGDTVTVQKGLNGSLIDLTDQQKADILDRIIKADGKE